MTNHSLQRLRILVADDNVDSAESWATLLKVLGHEVRTCYDGKQALLIAAEFRPQFALIDIGMPYMDGQEVARRIRKTEWGQSAVLVAVSGWARQEDKQKSLSAGFNFHFAKPLELTAIERLLVL